MVDPKNPRDSTEQKRAKEVRSTPAPGDNNPTSSSTLVKKEASGVSILIPVRGSEEFVEVLTSELPNDVVDILDILKAEIAPLHVWLKFAIEYYGQGKILQFKQILEEGTTKEVEDQYRESKTERIAILSVLSAYYIQLALKERDKIKRDEYFKSATSNFNLADKIDIHEPIIWLGKGGLLLAKGELDLALAQFETVLAKRPNTTPAILGKAAILYSKGNYEESLKYYKKALSENANCPINVRVGLAFCFFNLKAFHLAKAAFQRVLDLEEDNVEAIVGLGILEMNSEKGDAAVNYFKRAYKIDPSHPRVLNLLCKYLLDHKDYKKVTTLATVAFNNTDVLPIKAESLYFLGRCYQAQEEYDQALKYYEESVKQWPEFVLAQFGLGQMWIYKGEMTKSVTAFESVLAQSPENYETLKILGSLYRQIGEKEKATTHFMKITELQPKDTEAWVELALLVENQNLPLAISAYEKAVQLHKQRKQRVPSELWNNIGVLYYQLGQFKKAEEAYKEVFASSGVKVEEFKAPYITSTYNLARLYEGTNRPHLAQQLFTGILKEHPNYLDCYMRLGCIARDKGQFHEATEWFKEVFTINPENPDAWSLLGGLQVNRGESKLGKKKFERILQFHNKNDPYALLSLGNILFNSVADGRKGGSGTDNSDEEKQLKRATTLYYNVLHLDRSNLSAVNGLAMSLAESGRIPQAREILFQLRDKLEADTFTSTPNNQPQRELLSQVYVNIGHLHLSQGHFENAIKTYSRTLKKSYNNQDESLLLYLSKAYFEAGKLEECKKTLMKLIHLCPSNPNYRYNLALAQKTTANNLLASLHSRTTSAAHIASHESLKKTALVLKLSDLRSTVEELKNATSTFEWLSTLKMLPQRMFSTTRAAEQAKKCHEKAEILRKKLVEGQEEAKELEQLREKQLQEFQEEIRRKKEEEERQNEKRKQEEEEQQRKADEVKVKIENLTNLWAKDRRKETEQKQKEPRGRKRKPSEVHSEEEENDSDDADETGHKKKRESIEEFQQRKGPKMVKLVAKMKATQEEEKEAARRKRSAQLLGSDSEDEPESFRSKKRRKSRTEESEDFLNDDDESSDQGEKKEKGGRSGSDEDSDESRTKKEKKKKKFKRVSKKKAPSDDELNISD